MCGYLSESGSYGQVVFYYRKPVWQAISTIAMNSLATLTAIPVVPTIYEVPYVFSYSYSIYRQLRRRYSPAKKDHSDSLI